MEAKPAHQRTRRLRLVINESFLMLALPELGWFALAALVLVTTPGPNIVYCISRTLCQGRSAGLISLAGVLLGFVVHLAAATLGLSAVLLAVPLAFTEKTP